MKKVISKSINIKNDTKLKVNSKILSIKEIDKLIVKRISENNSLAEYLTDKKVSDSQRTLLGYIELRTQEILDAFKDQSSEYKDKINLNEDKVSVIDKKINLNIIPRLEKLEHN